MERFVWFITLGGIVLVTGLWLTAVTPIRTLPWFIGVVLALLGIGGLGYGIWSEIDIVDGTPVR